VTGGVVLAIASLGMLIYFIDHMFHGMQLSTIIARVSEEATRQIDLLYPMPLDDSVPKTETETALPEPGGWAPVLATSSGYIQYIDYDALLSLATHHDSVLRIEYTVGSFAAKGEVIALVHPAEKAAPGFEAAVNAALAVGTNPTMQQDIAFGIRQIVDIAIKAISPAVNDPTTALNCIDHLGVILARLMERKMPPPMWADSTGNLRLTARERDFPDLVRLSFDQIRHFGAGDPIIVIRLLDSIARLATACRHSARMEILADQVAHIRASARRAIHDEHELAAVQAHIEHAQKALGVKVDVPPILR
jgi:uncharacterized membrane protein